jgi:hypothetical protein
MFKNNIILKVPKRESFELAFFTLSDTIWIVDLGTETKNEFNTCVLRKYCMWNVYSCSLTKSNFTHVSF